MPSETYPTVLHSVVGVRAFADVEGLITASIHEWAYAAVREGRAGFGPRAFRELVGLRHLRQPDDAWAAGVVEGACAVELGADSPDALGGVAHAAANAWLWPNARAAAAALVLRLFDRPEPANLWAAGTLFLRDGVFPTDHM